MSFSLMIFVFTITFNTYLEYDSIDDTPLVDGSTFYDQRRSVMSLSNKRKEKKEKEKTMEE